jgi:hypothetical protein
MTILICLLPFVVLSFLNSMAWDDYNMYYGYHTSGFFRMQQNVYFTWAGRYTSTFICGLLVSAGLMDKYYFLHSLLLFFFTWGAILFLLNTLNRLLPGRPFTRSRIVSASFVLFFLFLYVQAEIATGFYWFSSALVYQTAFILFLVFAGNLVKRMLLPGGIRSRDLFLVFLIVLIIGCNELIAVFLLFFLLALAAACYYYGRPVPKFLLLYLAITALLGIFIIFTSGVISVRHKMMSSNAGYAGVLPAIVFQTIATLYYIFKEPLFWLSAFAMFAIGTNLSQDATTGAFALFRKKNIFVPGLLALLLVLIFTLTSILITTQGSLPLRALNNLTDLVTCCLLALFFLAGIKKGVDWHYFATLGLAPSVRAAILVAMLMANVNYWEAWKSVFSGYFYHSVLTDRDRQLRAAVEHHRKTETLAPYDEALKGKIRQVFPHGIFETVNTLLLEKPSLLWFDNGVEVQDPGYLKYYGLDTIIVRKK